MPEPQNIAQATLVGWRKAVVDRVAPRAASHAPVSEEQMRAAIARPCSCSRSTSGQRTIARLIRYEDTHLPLVAKFPGLRGYRSSLDVAAGEGESPYYCVFEADFHDAAALSAARESPEGQAVRADVPNYAPGGVVVLDYEIRPG